MVKYVCLKAVGRILLVGPGKSIEILCEGRMPASLSREDSGFGCGGDITSYYQRTETKDMVWH